MRAIPAGRMVRIEMLADVFNALNDTAEEGLATDTLTRVTDDRVPTFGLPRVFVDPRRLMLGVRFNFGAR